MMDEVRDIDHHLICYADAQKGLIEHRSFTVMCKHTGGSGLTGVLDHLDNAPLHAVQCHANQIIISRAQILAG